jgi:hypothetical protein
MNNTDMKHPLAPWLLRYGLFLLSVGIVAVMYDPKTGQLGFNPAAKTALVSGGICGGLSLAWGGLLGRGFSWARWGALVSSSLFLAAFTWRSIASWMAFAGGQTEKWFAASLITGMWFATVLLLIMLVRNRPLFAPDQPIAVER